MKQVELVNGHLRFPALLTGDGEPVILLHGFPDCHENWAGILERLADAGYTGVAPALRGARKLSTRECLRLVWRRRFWPLLAMYLSFVLLFAACTASLLIMG